MRSKRARRTTMAALAGASLLAGPVAVACSQEPTYEEWAATDGAAGRINLDEIQNAFKQADNPTDFEKRVNEIYEGDGIVLIRVEQDGDRMNLEGWEDLDKSGAIEDATDDKLFGIVRNNNEHEMRGHGANGYYRSHFGAGDFLFTYMLLSTFRPMGGYYYATPRGSYNSISRTRGNYRNSDSYRSQVSRNSRYFRNQKSFAGSSYDQASPKCQLLPADIPQLPAVDRSVQVERHRREVQLGQQLAGQLFWSFGQRIHRRRRRCSADRIRASQPAAVPTVKRTYTPLFDCGRGSSIAA